MIKFLLNEDIDDSVLIDENEIALMGKAKQLKYIKLANDWYLEEAISLSVPEENIKVYNPNIDTVDERDFYMKQLVEYFFLILAFKSLWRKKNDEDIYKLKLDQAQKDFDKYESKLSYDRIIGLRPAQTKTPNSYNTIIWRRGEGGRMTNKNENGIGLGIR